MDQVGQVRYSNVFGLRIRFHAVESSLLEIPFS